MSLLQDLTHRRPCPPAVLHSSGLVVDYTCVSSPGCCIHQEVPHPRLLGSAMLGAPFLLPVGKQAAHLLHFCPMTSMCNQDTDVHLNPSPPPQVFPKPSHRSYGGDPNNKTCYSWSDPEFSILVKIYHPLKKNLIYFWSVKKYRFIIAYMEPYRKAHVGIPIVAQFVQNEM